MRLSWLPVIGVLLVAAGATIPGFPADGDLDASIDHFQQWFTRHYHGTPAVRLSPAGGGMRMGVVATRPIAPEERYLSIPLDLVIGDRTIFHRDTGDVGIALRELQPRFPPRSRAQFTLALFLLQQRFVAGDQSFWAPYIALLPTTVDAPEFFAPEELAELQGTGIIDKAEGERAQRRDGYGWIERNVLQNPLYRGVFPAWAVSREHWGWAMGILNTRMIWWDGQPHLVPMLDMINCRQGPPGYTQRVHQTVREKDAAVTRAPWRFETGEQIFENYGQPNPTYFLWHGFAMEPNVNDCASVVLQTPASLSDADLRERITMARRHGAWAEDGVCVSAVKGMDALLASARALTGPRNHLTAHGLGKPLPAQLELRAVVHAGRSLVATVEKFPPVPYAGAVVGEAGQQSRREWLAAMEEQGVGFRIRMARFYRETQRARLLEAAEVLRAKRKSLKARIERRRKSTDDGGGEL